MTRVLVDARSAGSTRLTGWERYARGVVGLLADVPEVQLRITDPGPFPKRLAEDLVALPFAGRSADLAHHLTFPPARIAGPTVMTLHDLVWWTHPETASRGGRHYYTRLAERALQDERTSVATVSHTVAREIADRFGKEAHVVHPVVVPRVVPPARRERPYVLAVGSVEPRKNLARLVTAYERSRLGEHTDLVLAGRRAWGQLPPGVDFVEAPDDDELWALLRGASALVLPTLYEGFGMPVVEAQAVGVPVICSDLPVLREVSGGHACFVDPYDVDDIAAALAALAPEAPAPVVGKALELDLDAAECHSTRYGPATALDQLADLYRAHGLDLHLR
ncbi:glycosyltransferase family 1 protein [Actinomycetospora sp. NBRC 106378]|uniref:glycosyltransferase family 4 protein n=1 Tax=Actinomycetospora sp. NBRC 106378 TaxID=3032208 RepID=UPI0024A58239|nr:glycosyltransferase family 1 protein [Actinomycetospora sp. NBRC 106378]GLZ51671.1 glycosyl transferase family 1 [Actinomycetospora sp. NBRC 106378]